MKALTPDSSICPSCGEANACAMSEIKGKQESCAAADKCWCMAISPVVVGSEYPKSICLCERCLKHQMQAELGSEIEP